MVNQYINDNYELIETIAKRVLKARFREGISSYYLHIYDKNKVPPNPPVHIYYYMKNLEKPNSEINYTPVTFKLGVDDAPEIAVEEGWKKVEMMIDLDDEMLVDFLMNNTNNDKWLKIYEVMYSKKVELDMFENILFDYIFVKGWSIRKISAITGNGPSYTYQLRRRLIDKIKTAIINDGKLSSYNKGK